MANRFIGGVLSSRPQANTPFSSRASTGTYFNSAGTLVTAPVNQPRLNYNLVGSAWTQPSVLIEPASTNLITYSSTFSNAFWSLYQNNVTLTSNSTTAPDGTTTASTITGVAGTNFKIIGPAIITSWITISGAYTYSIFVKAGTATYATVWAGGNGVNFASDYMLYNLSTGTLAASTMGAGSSTNIINVGNGWWRISWTSIATAGSNISPVIGIGDVSATTRPGTTTSTGTLFIWGAQFEQGYTATSYIPTAGTAVTRAADVVGPGTSGIYGLYDRQNSTSNDDQSTVTSFTSTGSTSWTAPADVTSVEVLVVAGGGGGSGHSSGGGGAGGLIYNTNYPVTPGVTYPIVVGAGGVISAGGASQATNGNNSQFGTLVAVGGGASGQGSTNGAGRNGGSGAGASWSSTVVGQGVAGQGNAGGTNPGPSSYLGGGGGGAGGPGRSAIPSNPGQGGAGGPGLYFNISGTSVAYAGGGGGSGNYNSGTGGAGGIGGGGAGGNASGTVNGTNGTANTGGGGGGAGGSGDGSNGGSGIIIVKYKRTPRQITSTSNAAVVVQKFSTTNLWTVPSGVTTVEALVVAGGGAGGYDRAGGGGAGGLSYSSALAVTPGSTYTIGVGAGGIGGTAYRNNNGQSQSGFGSGIGTGTELITNGSAFTTTTGWSATTATLSVPQTGTFRILPNASVNGSASQTITTVIGTTYVVVVKVTSDVSKQFRLFVGSSQFGQQNASFFTAYTRDSLDNGVTGAGFYSVTFTASATTTWIDLQIGGGTQQATDISYISVRQATLPTTGGGYGGDGGGTVGATGGSGGGTGSGSTAGVGGSSTAGQGNSGGANGGGTNNGGAGGGGGAGSSGSNGGFGIGSGGNGGAGLPYAITGNLEYYAGGGGGGAAQDFTAPKVSGYGGVGGGGQGGNANTDPGKPGAPNTGGGGGGGSNITQGAGGNGGSGVVVIRYRVPQVAVFQDSGAWTCPAGVTSVQALIVAGGGGGGPPGGGGGGAGGLLYDNSIPVTPGVTYPIVVGLGGDGGVYNTRPGNTGGNSSFVNLIAVGGGAGGGNSILPQSGGSGGGQSGNQTASTSSGTYSQGNAGGTGTNSPTYQTNGGGGGAGSAGGNGNGSTACGAGGAGLTYSISGSSVTYAGGGGGSGGSGVSVAGAAGGSGGGGLGGTGSSNNPTPGLINTGGGGGGRGNGSDPGAHGGSGIVIIRWSGA